MGAPPQKFSCLDLLNGMTKGRTEGSVSEYTEIWLNPKEVKEAPNNTHKECRDIEQLADSFLLVGQEQPTVLARINGEYWIIDGHRRNLANIYNQERGYDQFKKVRYYYKDMTDTMYELSLLSGNAYTQELTPYEKTELAARLKAALKKARDSGEIKIKGGLRDVIGKYLNETSGQMGRIEKINNSLTEEPKEQFKAGIIGMPAAYEISTLPPEDQKEVAEIIEETVAAGQKIQGKEIAAMVKKRKEEKKAQPELSKDQQKIEELTRRAEKAAEKAEEANREAAQASLQAERSAENADQSAAWSGMNPPILSNLDTEPAPEEIEKETAFTLQELLLQTEKITYNELLVLQDILMKCNNR